MDKNCLNCDHYVSDLKICGKVSDPLNVYHVDETSIICTEWTPMVAESENDPVNHPSHYTNGPIECIDFIDSCGYGLDFCLANAIKYLTRCKLKGTMEQDIRKAIWYATHAADGIRDGKYAVKAIDKEEKTNDLPGRKYVVDAMHEI